MKRGQERVQRDAGMTALPALPTADVMGLTSRLCHLHHVYSYLSVLSLCPSLPIREGAAETQAMRTEGERDREVLLKQNTKRSAE